MEKSHEYARVGIKWLLTLAQWNEYFLLYGKTLFVDFVALFLSRAPLFYRVGKAASYRAAVLMRTRLRRFDGGCLSSWADSLFLLLNKADSHYFFLLMKESYIDESKTYSGSVKSSLIKQTTSLGLQKVNRTIWKPKLKLIEVKCTIKFNFHKLCAKFPHFRLGVRTWWRLQRKT